MAPLKKSESEGESVHSLLLYMQIDMQYVCYILYSKVMNRYYIGYTSDMEKRLQNHLDGVFGGKSFTSKAKDWEIFIVIPCSTIKRAIVLENKIKGKKSRKYIENLKKYPELLKKISEEL